MLSLRKSTNNILLLLFLICTFSIHATTISSQQPDISDQNRLQKEAKKELPVKISATVEPDLKLKDIKKGKKVATVTFKNTTKDKITIWPYLSAELLDADNNPVKESRSYVNWFRQSFNSTLEGVAFATIEPGQTYQMKINLKHFGYDKKRIFGWKLTNSGKYTLKLNYQYDREEMKQLMGNGASNLDDGDQPWNRAIEMKKSLSLNFEVK